MVVWVEAAAELRTIRISSLDSVVPRAPPPKIAPPSTDRTSPPLASLDRPIPLEPMPANDTAAKITIA